MKPGGQVCAYHGTQSAYWHNLSPLSTNSCCRRDGGDFLQFPDSRHIHPLGCENPIVVGPTGTSPFLEVPETAWMASNDLAFAIRDNFPASPGHTLVIPRRLVPDWDATTADEQQALLALVAEVKRRLREELRPDGFNIGINEGAAAGQTVFHLHVHVIPRFTGDVPDPRGGIRHAVMGKGNWQA